MSVPTADLCESLQTIDRKSEYVVEAAIPAAACRSIRIVFDAFKLDLFVVPFDSNSPVSIHSWEFATGVSPEYLTAEYVGGTLFIRIPKIESESWTSSPIQYRETIEIFPRGSSGFFKSATCAASATAPENADSEPTPAR